VDSQLESRDLMGLGSKRLQRSDHGLAIKATIYLAYSETSMRSHL